MNSLCNVSSLQCSCCELFTYRLCFVWRTLFCLWVGRSKRVVFGCKNPLHLFQHGLIEITGAVGASYDVRRVNAGTYLPVDFVLDFS